MKGTHAGPRSIHKQINKLLFIATFGCAVMMLFYILMLLSINGRYEQAILSATTAADFNQEFKNTIDRSMYHHVIQPRKEDNLSDLPMA